MSDPSEEESSSTSRNAETTSSNVGGGFYDRYRANRNIATPKRPSFLDESTTKVDGVFATTSKQNDFPRATLYSVSSTSSVLSTSTFGSLKRKRLPEVVSKPSFKVSELVGTTPHLPKFGTSLTKVKFDFTSSNSSMFYSGRTKFGGSSAIREESAKRIKISPVSYCARTNLTQVSAKPYSRTDNKRTLTSKTAENILKTLDKMCTPVKPPEKQQPYNSDISSSFSSLSRRLREKRKSGMLSLPPPPIARLNQMAPAQVISTKTNVDTASKETKASSEAETQETTEQPTVMNIDSAITETAEIQVNPQSEPPQPADVELVQTSDVVPVVSFVSVDSKTSESEVPIESEKVTKVSECAEVVKSTEVVTNSNNIVSEKGSTETPLSNSVESAIPKKNDIQIPAVSKGGFKMKRQSSRAHYTASEKVEEPINTMPEVTAVPSMVLTSLPSFDLSVKPASASILSPIAKRPKPIESSKDVSHNDINAKFVFSTPKMVSDRNIEGPSGIKYSFISPVPIKNYRTPNVTEQGKEKKSEIVGKSAGAGVTEISTSKSDNKPNNGIEARNDVPFKIGLKLPKKEEGSWDCPTCMITNKPDCLQCAACTEPKPGSKDTSSLTTISECSPAKKSVASSTFTFACTNVASSTGFTFSKPFSTICSSGFSFGVGKDVTATISSDSEAPKTDKSMFSFGNPIASTTSDPLKNAESSTGPVAADNSEKNEVSKPNPFLKLKPPEGSWECPTCMVNNNADAEKCVACTEPKPGSNPNESAPALADANKPEFKFGGSVNAGSTNFAFGATVSTSGGFSFGAPPSNSNVSGFSFGKPSDTTTAPSPFAKFMKPADGSWECPTCMITNKADCLKCAACTEPKPGAASDTTTSVPTENASEQPSSNPFSFGNSNSSSFSFGATAKSSSAECFSFQTVAATGNPFFKFNQQEEGSWSCPTCMITNKPDCLKCAACTEPKPGSNNLPNTESTAPSNQSAPSGFSFGKPPSETNGGTGFSFGSNSLTSKEAASFSFVPGVPSIPSIPSASSTVSSGYSFGKSSTAGSGFSFGNTASNTNSIGFSFGSATQNETKENDGKVTVNIFGGEDKKIENEAKPAPTGFSFGAVNNAEKPSIDAKPAGTGFSFGAVNNVDKPSNELKPASTGFSFGAANNIEKPATEVTSATGFSFGAINNVEKPSTEVKTASAGFNFGAVSNVEKPSAESANAASSNIFSSVPSLDTSKFNGMPAVTVNSNPQFSFGSNAKPSFLLDNKTSEPAPVKFNFNPSSMSSPNFSFGAASNAAAIFGNPTPSGQFSFANNVADGKRDIVHNSVNERRKVRRAHRKLPSRK